MPRKTSGERTTDGPAATRKTTTRRTTRTTRTARKTPPTTVASPAPGFTDEQVALLCKFRRVFVLYDAEPEAMENAEYLANKVSTFSEVIVLNMDEGDPGSLSRDDVAYLRQEIFGKIY